jgi:integrase
MATIRRRRDKYEVQIRRSGLPHLSKSFHVLKDAQAWARHKEVQVDRRDMPVDPKALQQVTLGELVTRYRDTVSVHKRGYDVERIVLNVFLLHPICRRRLSEITAAHFARYRDERLKEVKPTTLKRQLGPIRNLFNVAREEWDLPIRDNPLAKLQFKATDQRRERRLRPGELDKIIKAAETCRNKLIRPIILFALATAMRRGEILAVRQQHIDLIARSLLIRETKNGYSRIIPLSNEAIALLHDYDGEGQDRVFPVTANAFRLAWNRVRTRAKVNDLRFHDLRHEAISRFFEMGLTTPEVALISGHRDMRMLFRYSHALRENIIIKLNRMDADNGQGERHKASAVSESQVAHDQ